MPNLALYLCFRIFGENSHDPHKCILGLKYCGILEETRRFLLAIIPEPVANKTYGEYNNLKYELYLQCEFVEQRLNICYKASSQDDLKIDRATRESFIWENDNGKWKDTAASFGFTKPKRYGSGKTVTFGLYKDNELITDYLSAESKIYNAIDDFKRMINKLGISK